MPLVVGEFVGVADESFAVVLVHDSEDDASDNEQKTRDDRRCRADECGEAVTTPVLAPAFVR